ncbi:MAG: threonine/serine dehydratase [Chloroflexota bacterium]|nr:threonine/serine dehydratase [Chloroflexota bacterium]
MPDAATQPLVTLADIRAAADRLRGVALRTPLLPFERNAYLKPESLQPTGAFKLRGAYNAIAQLSAEQQRRGVVTHSSGNHGQAVAYVCRLLAIPVVVVMPDDAPRIKIARVEQNGARIVFVGRSHEERRERAHQLAERDGRSLIPSADDERVIAGQGTIGLEIVEQLTELGGLPTDLTVLLPIGGGGLAAGVSTAVGSLLPRARIVGVEPVLAADARDSLVRGEIVRWSSDAVGRTMADGLRMESVGSRPFAQLRRYLAGVLTVEEQEIGSAVAQAASRARLVLEPSGAVSLAALLFHREELAGSTVVAVLSGGNVDPERYAALLRRYHRADGP